uniref:Uncharacterized protein n=1 Tax=Neogobius melanostomus TaxID=47308 RepID=A0A8C6SUZ7_9GOBI
VLPDPGFGVRQFEVLVSKHFSVDGLSSGAVVPCKVAALAHEFGDDAVETGAFVAEALLSGAQGAEVLRGFGDNISEQDSHYSPGTPPLFFVYVATWFDF